MPINRLHNAQCSKIQHVYGEINSSLEALLAARKGLVDLAKFLSTDPNLGSSTFSSPYDFALPIHALYQSLVCINLKPLKVPVSAHLTHYIALHFTQSIAAQPVIVNLAGSALILSPAS